MSEIEVRRKVNPSSHESLRFRFLVPRSIISDDILIQPVPNDELHTTLEQGKSKDSSINVLSYAVHKIMPIVNEAELSRIHVPVIGSGYFNPGISRRSFGLLLDTEALAAEHDTFKNLLLPSHPNAQPNFHPHIVIWREYGRRFDHRCQVKEWANAHSPKSVALSSLYVHINQNRPAALANAS